MGLKSSRGAFALPAVVVVVAFGARTGFDGQHHRGTGWRGSRRGRIELSAAWAFQLGHRSAIWIRPSIDELHGHGLGARLDNARQLRCSYWPPAAHRNSRGRRMSAGFLATAPVPKRLLDLPCNQVFRRARGLRSGLHL